MLQSPREETEGNSGFYCRLRKNGLTSLNKEVRAFKEIDEVSNNSDWVPVACSGRERHYCASVCGRLCIFLFQCLVNLLCARLQSSGSHLFCRAPEKKSFLFFLWGDPVQNRPQNPAPAGCLFSTKKSRSEIPERGEFWEENWLGKGGVDTAKKEQKKGMRTKGGGGSC